MTPFDVAPSAARAARLAPSGIRTIVEAAASVPAALRLEVGEPDFATPPWIVEAGAAAARRGETRYTSNSGISPLRDAIAAKLTVRNGYLATSEQVVVTQGGVQALHLSFLSLLDPGDEVLLPDPAWPNFRMMAELVGAREVLYPLPQANGFLPDLDQLASLVTPRCKLLLVNFPSNPLGSTATAAQLAALCDFAAKHGLWLLSDECYDELTFDGPVVSAAAVSSYERIIGIYSFSKVYAMTGWRVGYAVAPAATAAVLAKVQEPLVSCINTPAQYAALAALEGDQGIVGDMKSAYRQRRNVVIERLGAAGLSAPTPTGAFYAWVDISATVLDSLSFCQRLLAEEAVAVAPGGAFGPAGEGRIRISIATAEATLVEAIDRLGRFIRRQTA